jgi:2-phospho-L-lactate/phosphoenolpyruvate guanylyltransferase
VAVWAIVPVKPFASAKTRLASVLSDEERAGLSREFLGHALDVLAAVPAVARTLVVSRDPAALAMAAAHGFSPVAESGIQGLNAALTAAARTAREGLAGAVLVLPTDLPRLTAAEVTELLRADDGQPQMVIAPDRHEQGTNALLLRPPEAVPFAFGEGSFARHIALAGHAGMRVKVCRLPGAALDVDVPEDLRWLRQGSTGGSR